MDEEDASSRASSPSKSPLLAGSSPFLDAEDQPLARQPAGLRAGRLSQQGLGSPGRLGQLQVPADAGAELLQQQFQRAASPLGRRPQLPTSWLPQQPAAAQEGLTPASAAGGLGTGLGAGLGGGLGGGRSGTPPARLFGDGGGLSGGLGGFGAGAAPSDPVTYQMQAQLDKDGVPNMGDVRQEEEGLGGAPRMHQPSHQQAPWHIPAVHTTPGSGSRQRVPRGSGGGGGQLSHGGKRGLDNKKPGAAFKLGKRQAYLKYLAYEGCWQLCLEEMLTGGNATATTFLTAGCGTLKKALGLEQLFLTQHAADPSLYTQDGMQCIWWVGGGGAKLGAGPGPGVSLPRGTGKRCCVASTSAPPSPPLADPTACPLLAACPAGTTARMSCWRRRWGWRRLAPATAT